MHGQLSAFCAFAVQKMFSAKTIRVLPMTTEAPIRIAPEAETRTRSIEQTKPFVIKLLFRGKRRALMVPEVVTELFEFRHRFASLKSAPYRRGHAMNACLGIPAFVIPSTSAYVLRLLASVNSRPVCP